MHPIPETIEILHRDDHLVVAAKPSGLLVHRGWDNDPIVAMTLVRDQVGRHVFPVHRLDRATSGALLFALDSVTAAVFQGQFEAGYIEKSYLALVRGVPPERGIIDHPVPKKEDGPRVPAVTEYRRIHTFERYSLMEVYPKTGRLHQIRRHFKHISHPLVGDVNYGKGDINRHFRERFGLWRLALHARSIAFDHPVSGERIMVAAPLPEDLSQPFISMGIPQSIWQST